MSTPNKSLLVIEQRNLFGGLDLVMPQRRGRMGRRMSVDGRFKVGFAAALALVVEHGKKAMEAAAVAEFTRCPRCGVVAKTSKAFGTRVIRGKRVPQSWCRDCRGIHLRPPAENQEDWLDS